MLHVLLFIFDQSILGDNKYWRGIPNDGCIKYLALC